MKVSLVAWVAIAGAVPSAPPSAIIAAREKGIYEAEVLLARVTPADTTKAAEVLWKVVVGESQYQPKGSLAAPSPLEAYFAAALGHCPRAVCPATFHASECLPSAAASMNVSIRGSSSGSGIGTTPGWPGAFVSLVPEGFWLRRRSLPGHGNGKESVMVFIGPDYRNSTLADLGKAADSLGELLPDSGRDGAAGAACWLYPGEHMSFALLTAMGGMDPSANAALAKATASAGETLAFNGLVGSALHLMGVDNFFHLVREGLGSILFLADALPPTAPILVPNTEGFRRALALLSSDSGFDRRRIVFVPAAVTAVTAGAFAIADWRPPSQPPDVRQSLEHLFSMEFSAEQSASVFMRVRSAVLGEDVAVVMNRKSDHNSDGDKYSENMDDGDDDEEVDDEEVEDMYGSEVSADEDFEAMPVSQPPKLLLYVSRSDSRVRRVPREMELLQALVSALEAHENSASVLGTKYRVEGVTLTGKWLARPFQFKYLSCRGETTQFCIFDLSLPLFLHACIPTASHHQFWKRAFRYVSK